MTVFTNKFQSLFLPQWGDTQNCIYPTSIDHSPYHNEWIHKTVITPQVSTTLVITMSGYARLYSPHKYRPLSLSQWVDTQECIHPTSIDHSPYHNEGTHKTVFTPQVSITHLTTISGHTKLFTNEYYSLFTSMSGHTKLYAPHKSRH